MTTIELARDLVRAARMAPDEAAAIVALFDALHGSTSWFCRSVEDDAGLTVETPYEPTLEAPTLEALLARVAALQVKADAISARVDAIKRGAGSGAGGATDGGAETGAPAAHGGPRGRKRKGGL